MILPMGWEQKITGVANYRHFVSTRWLCGDGDYAFAYITVDEKGAIAEVQCFGGTRSVAVTLTTNSYPTVKCDCSPRTYTKETGRQLELDDEDSVLSWLLWATDKICSVFCEEAN